MIYAIETTGLTKGFIPARTFAHFIVHPFQKVKPILAINNVSIQIRKGEVFALLFRCDISH
ncbi:MAG: hypothetical protein COX40_01230 [Candidatus Omnitrophica bacterium CG23_combo_of_CG06-09_8_20_14_all_40_11]|nr:MAG: hypothetical protein COX40_01230 [Candidatus Omnitrophica bacterium CG23_combo_of_CG06-09_8_20_14_all_40_11]